jgi:hypothetical protein
MLFASDMHAPFQAAVKVDSALAHAAWIHDPFHVIKRANKAIDVLRREMLLHASPELRAVGRGKRWSVLRAWEETTPEQRADMRKLFRLNPRLASAYQVLKGFEMHRAQQGPNNNLPLLMGSLPLRPSQSTNAPLMIGISRRQSPRCIPTLTPICFPGSSREPDFAVLGRWSSHRIGHKRNRG